MEIFRISLIQEALL